MIWSCRTTLLKLTPDDEADLDFQSGGYEPPSDYMVSWGYVEPEPSKLRAKLSPWVSAHSEAASELGSEAKDAYDLGPTELGAYAAQLSDFVSSATFPFDLEHDLRAGIGRYLGEAGRTSLPKQAYDVNETVWQTDREGETAKTFAVQTWRDHHCPDEGWAYHSLTNAGADAWVSSTFPTGRIRYLWDNLRVGILKADVLRYLLLLVHGGVYSDTDTECLKPMADWGRGAEVWKPELWASEGELRRLRAGEDAGKVLGRASVIVGVEVDVHNRHDWHNWWPRPLQIVQWTMASAPHHPITLSALLRIVHRTASAAEWAQDHWRDIQFALHNNDTDRAMEMMKTTALSEPSAGGPVGIMDWTGPGIWTDAVLQYLAARYGCQWTDLRGLDKPLRVGDVIVLPVTGFSPEVGQFGSQSRDDPQAMVWHYFRGSWKADSGGMREVEEHVRA